MEGNGITFVTKPTNSHPDKFNFDLISFLIFTISLQYTEWMQRLQSYAGRHSSTTPHTLTDALALQWLTFEHSRAPLQTLWRWTGRRLSTLRAFADALALQWPTFKHYPAPLQTLWRYAGRHLTTTPRLCGRLGAKLASISITGGHLSITARLCRRSGGTLADI